MAAISDETVWIDTESFEAAKTSVYVAPVGVGPGPFTLDQTYKTAAKKIAEERIALARARLANFLNANLVLADAVQQVDTPASTTVAAADKIVIFNTQTLKYHDPSCTWARRCTRNCVAIPLSEARRRGGIPSKVCGGCYKIAPSIN